MSRCRGGGAFRGRRRLTCETLEARQLLAGDLTLQQSFYPDSVGPQPDSGFARSLDASDRYLVVGAPLVDTASGNDVGQVYIYDAADQLVATLEAPNTLSGGNFGKHVAADGDRVVVLGRGEYVNGQEVHVIHLYSVAEGSAQLDRSISTIVPIATGSTLYDLALDGDDLAIGVPTDSGSQGVANSGAVFVYRLSAEAGAAPLKIVNPEPAAEDRFGASVALQNGVLGVGVPLDGVPALDESGQPLDHGMDGSVMLFDIAGTSPTHLATVESPQQHPTADGRFGTSLAIDGTTLVVGEPGVDVDGYANAGALHVFDLSTPATPVSQAIVSNPVPSGGDQMGISVDVDGSRIVAGAPLASMTAGSAGVAFAFDLSTGLPTPTEPNRYSMLSNPEPSLRDNFGSVVAVRGTSMWATVPFDPGAVPSGSSFMGSVERFTSTASGVVHAGPLYNPTPASGDRYGSSVAMTDRWMAVGVPAEDGEWANTGGVEVYDLATGSPVLLQSLAPEGLPAEAGFGRAVALHGDTLVVSAPGGSLFGRVYLYDLSTGSATLMDTIDAPNAAKEREFGYSLGFDGLRLVIGDRTAVNDTSVSAGAAYVYNWDGSQAVLVATLHNPAPDFQDLFGESVAVEGNTVAVGAFRDDGTVDFSGLVHVYKLSATGAALYATLDSPNPGNANGFGGRVAVSGDSVLASVMGDDTLGGNSGAVYVYDTAGPSPVLTQSIQRQGSSYFGAGLAVDGDRLAIGAQFERLDGVSGGAVHLYERINGTYQPLTSLANPAGGALDGFGVAVDVGGGGVLAGAPGTVSVGKNQGAAYLYATPRQTGVTLLADGTVLITGTPADDRVTIRQTKQSLLIQARFGTDGWLNYEFSLSEVTRVVVSLGDGNDRLDVHKQVSVPVLSDDASSLRTKRSAGKSSVTGGWSVANSNRDNDYSIDEALLALLDEWAVLS